MRIAAIVNNDLANGPGVRTSVFVSGCNIHCPGCHNKELQDFNYGTELTDATIKQIIELLTENGIKRGLSILGGEPLDPANIDGVMRICRAVKEALPDTDIWLWTGYNFTEKKFCSIMYLLDVVVDGPFIEELKPGIHPWRGSSNQTIWFRQGSYFNKMS